MECFGHQLYVILRHKNDNDVIKTHFNIAKNVRNVILSLVECSITDNEKTII